MSTDEVQDVTSVQENTVASSSENQTTETTAEVKTDAVKESEKAIPYRRFSEVNESLKKERSERERLQKELESLRKPQEANEEAKAVREQLKNLGFITREEQEAEMRRREEDTRVQNELSKLESSFDGKDGRPKFDRAEILEYAVEKQIGDLETAYWAMHKEALLDWHIKQAVSKSSGVKTETSDGSGSQEAGTTNADLKAAIARGDKDALRTFLKRQFISK